MDEAVPEPVAAVATGPELCSRLAALDVSAADDDQLLTLLRAHARQLSYQQAQLWSVMAELAQREPNPNASHNARWGRDEVFESAVQEVRAELLLTSRAARREVDIAWAVCAQPRILHALQDGSLDRARAIVLADGCLDLTDPQATVVLDRLLPEVRRYTVTQLADKVRQLAIALDPAWAERRYREAIRERKVVGYLNRDGSATVAGQNLPADAAAVACARVDALADAAKRAGAAAPLDHLRSDVYLGLLDGTFHGQSKAQITTELLRRYPKHAEVSEPPPTEPMQAHPTRAHTAAPVIADARVGGAVPEKSAAGAVESGDGAFRGVHVRVGLGTLLGLDEQPGEIPGWGPVPATVARKIVDGQHRCEWRYAIVDEGGHLLFEGTTRCRPRADQSASGAEAGSRTNAPKPGGVVELHVPLALLTGATDTDGGTGTGRAAPHPMWAALLADLVRQYREQQPIQQDPSARFAGRPLRRRTQTLFQHCIFPGCRRPATDCDLDHHREHAHGGKTEPDNLGPGCRRDHGLKTSRGWRLIRTGEHTYLWISPLGGRHTVRIEPVAEPLPTPVPREQPPDLPFPDDPAPGPSYKPLDRRGHPLSPSGLPLAARDHASLAAATESTADPPPF